MSTKNPIITQIRIETPDGYEPLENVELVELTTETEQERLNRMAVDYIKENLPDNMELVSRYDDDGKGNRKCK